CRLSLLARFLGLIVNGHDWRWVVSGTLAGDSTSLSEQSPLFMLRSPWFRHTGPAGAQAPNSRPRTLGPAERRTISVAGKWLISANRWTCGARAHSGRLCRRRREADSILAALDAPSISPIGKS